MDSAYKKTTCIITNEPDYSRKSEDGVLRFSNNQWLNNPSALEGYEFKDVIINCTLDESLRSWLHMHLGIRIDSITYRR